MRGKATICAAILALPLVATLSVWARAPQQEPDAGFWYLLARWAGRPQRNYYELTRYVHFVGPISEEGARNYKPSFSKIGVDIITDDTVRYDVYQAWKVRVLKTTGTKSTPVSAKDGVYVLIYGRNPDWKFAVKKYRVERRADGGQIVTYTDFQDGHEYVMDLSADWPRPWTVYEIEVQDANAFLEIWHASQGPFKMPKH